MKQALKSEFRKLLTIRSTYIITAVVLLFVCFIAFYVEGWRLTPSQLQNTHSYRDDVLGALTLSLFGAIVAILSMTHEYRYNTIMYTLTSSNSRSKVLIAKIIAISSYALFLTVLIGVLSPLMSYLGIHASGHTLVHQVFNYKDTIWRALFYGWSYGMTGLLLALLLRNQVASIAALFVLPAAIEPLLSQLLSKNSVYLPFTALGQIVGNTGISNTAISPSKAALIYSSYLLVGWIVAWVLFFRRDAN